MYLEFLAREPDTFVAKRHGNKVAESVLVRAQEALQEAKEGNPELVTAFADSLVEEGINPGTTADIVAARPVRRAGAGCLAVTNDDWPVELRGVTESVVTTLGPNDLWNVAALGLHADDDDRNASVTARTWGNTRTRRNFHRQGGGVVQFTRDPRGFRRGRALDSGGGEPVLDSADAWVEIEAEQIGAGETDGTRWEEWELTPVESEVRKRRVPLTNRGFAAVVEATVAASRLGVEGYDSVELRTRLDYFRGGRADVRRRARARRVRPDSRAGRVVTKTSMS